MSDKLVHVKSYTRDDGTKVKEHYRGGDSNIENDGAEQTPLLFGGVNEDVYYPEEKGFLEKYGDVIDVAVFVAQMAGTIAQEGLRIASALKSADEASSVELGAKMEEVVGNMRQAHSLSVSTEQATLEKLSNTTNQREYKELYDTYLAQRESNRATGAIINRIAYSTEHKNYDDVEKGLNEYKSLHTQSAQSVMDRANLNARPNSLQFEEQALPQILPDITDMYKKSTEGFDKTLEYAVNTGLHDYPKAQKSAISVYMNSQYSRNAYDANELWKAAAYDFEQSGEYIEQNGYLLDTIDSLSEPFQSEVRKKVKEQIGIYDSKGLILMPNSTLSKEILNSPELNEFIKENREKLLQGRVVSGSKCFSSNENLALAIGNADIINTYMATNGDIVSYVLDTYDFNKDDPRWKVKVAYNVQRNGLLTNFYTLNIIIIPKEQWMF